MKAKLWFKEDVSLFANKVPDVKRRELPSCMTVTHTYLTFPEFVENPLSLTQFRQMWGEKMLEIYLFQG